MLLLLVVFWTILYWLFGLKISVNGEKRCQNYPEPKVTPWQVLFCPSNSSNLKIIKIIKRKSSGSHICEAETLKLLKHYYHITFYKLYYKKLLKILNVGASTVSLLCAARLSSFYWGSIFLTSPLTARSYFKAPLINSTLYPNNKIPWIRSKMGVRCRPLGHVRL